MTQDTPATSHNPNLIENRPVTVTKGWLHAFVSQTDWEGPVWQETWYGHHAPCRRLALWLLLPLVLFPVVAPWLLATDDRLPYVLDPDFEYAEFEALTVSCVEAVRRLAHDVPLACRIVDTNSQRGQFIWEEYEGTTDEIAWPAECQTAARVMLNPAPKEHRADVQARTTNEEGTPEEEDAPVDWNFHEVRKANIAGNDDDEEDTYTMLHSLRLSKEECAIEILDSKGESYASMGLLGGIFRQQQEQPIPSPGGRIDNVLGRAFDETYARIDRMLSNVDVRKLFDNRLGIVMVVGGGVMLTVVLLDIIVVSIQLVFLTFVVRLVLPKMSKDYLVGLNQVSFWSTWQAFVLLTVLTQTENDLFGDKAFVLMVIPAAIAFHYHEHKAALEWAFLAVLSYGLESAYPVLDGLAATIQTVDALGIVHGVASFLGMLIPGDGWHKLVRVYFFGAGYPPVRQLVTRGWQQKSRVSSNQQQSALPSGNSASKEFQPPSFAEAEDNEPGGPGNMVGEAVPGADAE